MTALRESECRQRMDLLICLKPLYKQAANQQRTLRAGMRELSRHLEAFERNRLRHLSVFRPMWIAPLEVLGDRNGDAIKIHSQNDLPNFVTDGPSRDGSSQECCEVCGQPAEFQFLENAGSSLKRKWRRFCQTHGESYLLSLPENGTDPMNSPSVNMPRQRIDRRGMDRRELAQFDRVIESLQTTFAEAGFLDVTECKAISSASQRHLYFYRCGESSPFLILDHDDFMSGTAKEVAGLIALRITEAKRTSGVKRKKPR